MIFLILFLIWVMSVWGLTVIYSEKNVSRNPAAFLILLTPIVNTLVLIKYRKEFKISFGFKQLFKELNQ